MADVDLALNVRALNGDLILALEDEANGYWVRGEGLPAFEVPRIKRESQSPWVDGRGQDGSTKDQFEASVLVKVFGPTWAITETRFHALLAAVDLDVWLLEEVVEGVITTWRAGPVSVLVPPKSTVDIVNKRRNVVLTFSVQPTPAVTFPEEP